MEEEIITKEIAKDLMKIRGEVRGATLKADGEYVLQAKGEEGLRRLEKEMVRLGYPLEYKRVKAVTFYPIGLRAISLAAIKKVFNLNDKDFCNIGIFESKLSLIMRMFMKYFFSIDLMLTKVSEMWRKYYAVGDMKVVDYEKDKRRGTLRIENFYLHPLHCRTLEGFISSIIKMIVNSDVSCKEIKCPFWGDDYHEFSVKW